MSRVHAIFVAASLTLVAAGCAGEALPGEALPDEEVGAAREALAGGGILVGTLQYGQTSAPVTTSGPIRFRAFRFDGEAGDQVVVDVRSTNGDAVAWLLGPDLELLAHDDDSAPGSSDSHIEAALADGGSHYILFADARLRRRTFTVELQGGEPEPPSRAIGVSWTSSQLVTFDPAAGSIEEVHLQMAPFDAFIAMTYDPDHGLLYAVAQVTSNLYAIDVATMSSTHIGSLQLSQIPGEPFGITGLAYDPTTDTLYGTVVRYDRSGDPLTWRTDLVRIDVDTAAVMTVGTIAQWLVSSMDFSPEEGRIYALAQGSDLTYHIVRIGPLDATLEDVLATPYVTMIGFARTPGTRKYVSWINTDSHFYGEIDLDAGTITPLGNADAVDVIAAFVHRSFEAGSAPVPRPELPAAFEITGTVVAVQDPFGMLNGSISEGDAVTGRIAYDANSPYRTAPFAGAYELSLSIDGSVFTVASPTGFVANNYHDDRTGSVTDRAILTATRQWEPGFPVPMSYEQISWTAFDSTAQTMSNNDALPLVWDPSDWDTIGVRIVAATNEFNEDGYVIDVEVEAVTPE